MEKDNHTDRPSRILLAEDDEEVRWSLEQLLLGHGFEVSSVSTGAELLEDLASSMLLAHRTPEPDLIISDVRMPGFNGLSILQGLRLAGWLTPFVLITAYGDQETRERALSAGVTAYLEKPIDLGRLEIEVLRAAEQLQAEPGHDRRATLAVDENQRLLDVVRVFREEEVQELLVLRKGPEGWLATGVLRRDRVAQVVLSTPSNMLYELRVGAISEPTKGATSAVDRLLSSLGHGEIERAVALLRATDQPPRFTEVRGVSQTAIADGCGHGVA